MNLIKFFTFIALVSIVPAMNSMDSANADKFEALYKAAASPVDPYPASAAAASSSADAQTRSPHYPFPCLFACTKGFTSAEALMAHIHNQHPERRSYLVRPKTDTRSSNSSSSSSSAAAHAFKPVSEAAASHSNKRKLDEDAKLAADQEAPQAKRHKIEAPISAAELFKAIETNAVADVAKLIAGKVDVNSARTLVNGTYLIVETPLSCAAKVGNKDIIKLLVDAKACPNSVAANALAQSTQSGSLDLLFTLLQHGADVNIIGQNGKTIFDCVQDSPMKEAMLALLNLHKKKQENGAA